MIHNFFSISSKSTSSNLELSPTSLVHFEFKLRVGYYAPSLKVARQASSIIHLSTTAEKVFSSIFSALIDYFTPTRPISRFFLRLLGVSTTSNDRSHKSSEPPVEVSIVDTILTRCHLRGQIACPRGSNLTNANVIRYNSWGEPPH